MGHGYFRSLLTVLWLKKSIYFFLPRNPSNLILFQDWTAENIPAKPVILSDLAGALGSECKQVSVNYRDEQMACSQGQVVGGGSWGGKGLSDGSINGRGCLKLARYGVLQEAKMLFFIHVPNKPRIFSITLYKFF